MEAEIGKQRSLHKFFDTHRYAEDLADGKMLFRALSYFRDVEDEGVRGDPFEGSASYRPDGGLVMTNHTQGSVETLADHAVHSTATQEEIFAFCLSRSMTERMWSCFNATACVEITNLAAFCRRVQAATPAPATFLGPPGNQRIGARVSYYHPAREKEARWALPDQIAITKHEDFAWQNEFRLLFSHSDALSPYRTQVTLISGEATAPPKGTDHPRELIEAASMRDICIIHTR